MNTISTSRLVLILGALVAAGPLSIDMYLPSLPALQHVFNVDESQVQLTLVAFFIGLASGQLFYGPVSDRYGRKIPLLIGLAIFTLASLMCALSTSIEMLTLSRFLQALGGCAGMVISRAITRDLFEPHEMARVMSLLVLVMGICPILAPVLGSYVFQIYGWHAIFWLITVFGVLLFWLVGNNIPETLQHGSPSLSFGSVLTNYRDILRDKTFIVFALCGGISFSGMFAYISASSFVFINQFGVSSSLYGWIFGANAAALIIGSQINRQLLMRRTSHFIIRRAVLVYAASGLSLLALALSGKGGMVGILVPLFICIGSLGFIFPNSTALAMAPFSRHAGSASALLGTLQFGFAAVTGTLVGRLPWSGSLAMAAVIACCGGVAALLLYAGTASHEKLPAGNMK